MAKAKARRKLTQLQAWRSLFYIWNQAPECYENEAGLCRSICRLHGAGRITRSTMRTMHARVERYAPPMQFLMSFNWPRGERAPRAAFCLAMIRDLTRRQPRCKAVAS
jgi:hypothetical protein